MAINFWDRTRRISAAFIMMFCIVGITLDITGGTYEHAFLFALVMYLSRFVFGDPWD